MSHSEGERHEGDCFREDLGSLSPSVQHEVAELALYAFLEDVLRGRRLRMRRDCFKAFQSATAYNDSLDFDPAEQ